VCVCACACVCVCVCVGTVMRASRFGGEVRRVPLASQALGYCTVAQRSRGGWQVCVCVSVCLCVCVCVGTVMRASRFGGEVRRVSLVRQALGYCTLAQRSRGDWHVCVCVCVCVCMCVGTVMQASHVGGEDRSTCLDRFFFRAVPHFFRVVPHEGGPVFFCGWSLTRAVPLRCLHR
jgi:hypothetical protein